MTLGRHFISALFANIIAGIIVAIVVHQYLHERGE